MKAYYYHFPNSSAPHAALLRAVKAGESPFAQNPVLAHLAQQIAKQVRKGGKA